ncbi:MAG: hypothetical protein EP337_00190 [Rhodobacteraceae bacterium]|nr:MAG: hypothetical protein EP337_00190 [Paracoccaceae bacterium]
MKSLFCMFVITLFTFTLAGQATAAARHYLLDGQGSQVGFSTDFGDSKITGRFPVAAATLHLDFRNVSNSAVNVTLDVYRAVANFPFAAQAIKGPKMLDARHFPTIDFQSTRVRRSGKGAIVDGMLTLRGVTRPISLRAVLMRAAGSDPGDLDHLIIRLTGAVSRSAFGASGWPDAVGDEVLLVINARIALAE